MKKLFLSASLCSVAAVVAQVGITSRVSIGAPLPPNGDSSRLAVSETSRYVVYESAATDIVGNDTNGATDIFLYDRDTGTTERVSLTSTGVQANDDCLAPDVSSNGRYVVFQSSATNLVPDDFNNVSDIFVRDRQTMNTFRVSVSSGGAQANAASSDCAISDNGAFLVYLSFATNLVAGDTNGTADAFRYDLNTGTTTRVSISNTETESNAATTAVQVDGDGNMIAFTSTATNLVTGDTNGVGDVFVRDVAGGNTLLLSRSSSNVIGNAASRSPSIDFNGNVVAFRSSATNLVSGDTNAVDDVFVRTLSTSTTVRASVSTAGIQGNQASLNPALTSNGSAVAFQSTATNLVTGDTNGVSDVFLRNLATNQTSRVSTSGGGTQGNGASTVPAMGSLHYVMFVSDATNLVSDDSNGATDGFSKPSAGGAVERVTNRGTHSNNTSNNSGPLHISASGRYLAFSSNASNLAPETVIGNTDVFHFDLLSFSIQLVSLSNSGAQANSFSIEPSLSADGRFVEFESEATNLVVGDTNSAMDIFVRDVVAGTTTRVSVSSAGAQGNSSSTSGVISENGRYVVFGSSSTNLVAGDTNATHDIFRHDLQTGQTIRISLSNTGQQSNAPSSRPAISADGNLVAFQSSATNLVAGDTNAHWDIFVRNVSAGTTERVSVDSGGAQANEDVFLPAISAEGTKVAFKSLSTNLVPGDTNGHVDIFVRDRISNQTVRVSVSDTEAQSNGPSDNPSISADGNSIAFESDASNLVASDTNGVRDVFVRTLSLGATRLASVSSQFAQGNQQSANGAVSADGLAVAFMSLANNLDPFDTNLFIDPFLNDSRLRVDTLTRVRGVLESGSLNNVLFPDDLYYIVRPGITFTTQQAPVEIVVEGTGLVLNPTRLEFAIEVSTTSPSLRQTIELFNFDTQLYELVDTRQTTTIDTSVVVPITSNPGRFVGANGELRARLAYKVTGPLFSYPWRTRIDYIRWTQFN